MDLTLIVGILVALAAVWILLLPVFWVLRPKGVPVRELLKVIPDVLRLIRSLIGDRRLRSTSGWSLLGCWPGS